jgi:hypothetical protein
VRTHSRFNARKLAILKWPSGILCALLISAYALSLFWPVVLQRNKPRGVWSTALLDGSFEFLSEPALWGMGDSFDLVHMPLSTTRILWFPQWYHTPASGSRFVAIPLWIPALGAAAFAAALFRLDRFSRVGLCRKCGYDLPGLSTGVLCPECGAARPAATSGATAKSSPEAA